MHVPTPIDKEILFDEDQFVVSKTDIKGNITYGNRLFIELTGYSKDELLGAPHNIIRHPDMPAAVFWLLWDTVQKGNEINAYVKNLAKSGAYYWVFANVTPSFDSEGKIIGYHSIRRAPTKEQIKKVLPLYQALLEIEKNQGLEASVRHLVDLLNSTGVSYEEFIFSL